MTFLVFMMFLMVTFWTVLIVLVSVMVLMVLLTLWMVALVTAVVCGSTCGLNPLSAPQKLTKSATRGSRKTASWIKHCGGKKTALIGFQRRARLGRWQRVNHSSDTDTHSLTDTVK